MTELTFYIFCGFQNIPSEEVECNLIKVAIPNNDDAEYIKSRICGGNDEVFMCIMEENENMYGEHRKALDGQYCLWGFIVEDPSATENKGEVIGNIGEYILDMEADFEIIELGTHTNITPEKVDSMVKPILTENDIQSLETYHS